MDTHILVYLNIFAIFVISEIIFSLFFVLFVNKFIQDPKKRKNTIIRYVFFTVFMILGVLAGLFSHS